MMSLLPQCPLPAERVRVLFLRRTLQPKCAARRNLCVRRLSRIACRGRIDCNKFEAGVAPAWQPMFERSDNVMPVASERAMIAIVKHDDVAIRAARACGSRDPGNQTLGRLRL